ETVEVWSRGPQPVRAWRRTRFLALTCFIFAAVCFARATDTALEPKSTVLVVFGAPGEEEFGKAFSQWAGLWEKAAGQAGANFLSIGVKPPEGISDREKLEKALADESKQGGDLWLVLIGHGTFDGKEAKFNLRGPDISATELAEGLKPFRRPLAVINCASSSGPFVHTLSATNRVIVAAARCGYEQNYAPLRQY